MTNVNVELPISEKEQRRLCIQYLRDRYLLNYEFRDGKILKWESGYQNQTWQTSIGQVTPAHELAKELYTIMVEEDNLNN